MTTATTSKWRKIRGPAVRMLVLLALVSGLLCAPTCHNRLFLFPSTTIERTPADARLEYEDVSFASSNGKLLKGWYLPAPDAIGAVVINHGNAGNIEMYLDYAEMFVNAGISLLLYDYQGFGHSEGSKSVRHLLDDSLAAFDYLASRDDAPDKIAVMGVSLGTPLSCAVLAKRPQAVGLILEGSFVPKIEVHRRLGLLAYPVMLTLPVVDPLAQLEHFNGRPVLMVHGVDDATTPIDGAARLFEATGHPKSFWIVDGVKHFPELTFYRRIPYEDVLTSFLRHVFLDEEYAQPVVEWSAKKEGNGWTVQANVSCSNPEMVKVIVITSKGKVITAACEATPEGTPLTLIVPHQPLTVSAYVEPEAFRRR